MVIFDGDADADSSYRADIVAIEPFGGGPASNASERKIFEKTSIPARSLIQHQAPLRADPESS
jgi:hypothetical protein